MQTLFYFVNRSDFQLATAVGQDNIWIPLRTAVCTFSLVAMHHLLAEGGGMVQAG